VRTAYCVTASYWVFSNIVIRCRMCWLRLPLGHQRSLSVTLVTWLKANAIIRRSLLRDRCSWKQTGSYFRQQRPSRLLLCTKDNDKVNS